MKAIFKAWGDSFGAIRKPGTVSGILSSAFKTSFEQCIYALMLFGGFYAVDLLLSSYGVLQGVSLWTLYGLSVVLFGVSAMLVKVSPRSVSYRSCLRYIAQYIFMILLFMFIVMLMIMLTLKGFGGKVYLMSRFNPALAVVVTMANVWFSFAACARAFWGDATVPALMRGWRIVVREFPYILAIALLLIPFGGGLFYISLSYGDANSLTFFRKFSFMLNAWWQLVTWGVLSKIYLNRASAHAEVLDKHDDADDALGDEY